MFECLMNNSTKNMTVFAKWVFILGKDKLWPADKPQGECVVLHLMQPYVNKGQNVTTNNFITSVKLTES